MAKFLVLLGTPRDLHIPYFAMGVRHTRENSAARRGIDGELTKVALDPPAASGDQAWRAALYAATGRPLFDNAASRSLSTTRLQRFLLQFFDCHETLRRSVTRRELG